MRVHLKGIHSAVVKLAGGRRATLLVRLAEGPAPRRRTRFPGILRQLHGGACIATRARPRQISLDHRRLQGQPGLPRARGEDQGRLSRHIAQIENAFGDLPLDALEDARVTNDFLEWRDSMAGARDRGLRLDGPEAADVMGEVERHHALSAAGAGRSALSRRPLGKDLGGNPPRRLHGGGVRAVAAGARARARNRPAPRRHAAAAVVGLRRDMDQVAAVEDRPPREHPGHPSPARRARQQQAHRHRDPDQQARHRLDKERLRQGVA